MKSFKIAAIATLAAFGLAAAQTTTPADTSKKPVKTTKASKGKGKHKGGHHHKKDSAKTATTPAAAK